MKKEIGETFALFCLCLVIFVAIIAIPMMILNFMGYNEIVEIFEYILGGGVAIITLWLIVDFLFRALRGFTEGLSCLLGTLKNITKKPSISTKEAKKYILNSLKFSFILAIFLGWFWLCLSVEEPSRMIIFGIPFVVIAYVHGRSSMKQKQTTRDSDIEKWIQDLLKMHQKIDNTISLMEMNIAELDSGVDKRITKGLNNCFRDFNETKERIEWQISKLEDSKADPALKKSHF